MHKAHVALISLLLAGAAVAGAVAVARTTGLGAASRRSNVAVLAAKERQLAAYERRLRRALAAKTPSLPPLPKAARTPAQPAAQAQTQQRVVYRRPPPVVVVKHTHHGDDGEAERAEGGGDD